MQRIYFFNIKGKYQKEETSISLAHDLYFKHVACEFTILCIKIDTEDHNILEWVKIGMHLHLHGKVLILLPFNRMALTTIHCIYQWLHSEGFVHFSFMMKQTPPEKHRN